MPRDSTAPEFQMLPEIVEAVAEQVERTSLRAVARQVGMSASGISKVLAGALPYSKSMRKLEAWHIRHLESGAGVSEVPSPATTAAAIRILSLYLPPGSRDELVDSLLVTLTPRFPRNRKWQAEFRKLDAYCRGRRISEAADLE